MTFLNDKGLSVNQLIQLKIDDLVQGGEGIGKIDNFAVFVPQSVPGDTVEAEIISLKPNYGRAIITKVIEPSEYRVKPLCPVTAECGGCQWQEIDYKKQLESKEKNLIDNLIRIAEIPEDEINQAHHKIIGMETPFYYRNKGQFPFAEIKGKVKGGFYKPRSHDIVEFEKCYIQSDRINFVFRLIRDILRKYEISIYNEKTGKGFFRHLVVRHAFTANQILVGFVTTSGKFTNLSKIIEEITEKIPEVVGIVQNINDKNTNVILGEKNKLLWGTDYIIEQLGDLKYKISLHSFFQVNPIQTMNLYQTVLDYADLKGHETVLDAYAGAGSISLWLAKHAKKVIGIEVVQAAVNDGIENAKLNGIDNFVFKKGKVEEMLPSVLGKNNIDLVVLDPPRKGCEDYIFDTIADNQVKKVVYVSCNPSTLARDAKLLSQAGYKLTKFQPVDMFPHTYHLETVALFEQDFEDI